MKFTDSLSLPSLISSSLDDMLINSSARFSSDSVMNFDDFTSKIESFHSHSINHDVLSLTTNFNQPIFDFSELKAQLDIKVELSDITNSLSMDDEPSL